jgi:hypothetical protein
MNPTIASEITMKSIGRPYACRPPDTIRPAWARPWSSNRLSLNGGTIALTESDRSRSDRAAAPARP